MEKSPSPIPIVSSKAEDERKAEAEILNEKTNMDPLEYFSRFLDIPEMIFKHFNGKDLITASEVSPSYYNFIASSKVFMQKIQVVFYRDIDFDHEHMGRMLDKYIRNHRFGSSPMNYKFVFTDFVTQSEDFDLLKNSSRLHQSIKIKRLKLNRKAKNGNQRVFFDGDFVTNPELNFFYSKAYEWKNVSLANVYFRKKLDLWRLLSAIESSVESITVEDFGVLPFEDPFSEIESFEALKFPKLKQLTVRLYGNSFSETLIRFLLNSVSIEDLYLEDFRGEFDKDILTKMLENFGKLKSFSIISRTMNQIFRDDSWKKFQFKLSYFLIDHIEHRSTHFLNFLKSQSDHLEILWIKVNGEERETFDVIMKMPKLKRLALAYFKPFFEIEFPNKMSTSITKLTLYKCARGVILKNLLDLLPNVRFLSLELIDKKEFKMLRSTRRKFENLEVRELKGVDLKKLKKIMTKNYTSLEIVK